MPSRSPGDPARGRSATGAVADALAARSSSWSRLARISWRKQPEPGTGCMPISSCLVPDMPPARPNRRREAPAHGGEAPAPAGRRAGRARPRAAGATGRLTAEVSELEHRIERSVAGHPLRSLPGAGHSSRQAHRRGRRHPPLPVRGCVRHARGGDCRSRRAPGGSAGWPQPRRQPQLNRLRGASPSQARTTSRLGYIARKRTEGKSWRRRCALKRHLARIVFAAQPAGRSGLGFGT